MVAVVGDKADHSEKYGNVERCRQDLIKSKTGDRKWNQTAISGRRIMFPACHVDAIMAKLVLSELMLTDIYWIKNWRLGLKSHGKTVFENTYS